MYQGFRLSLGRISEMIIFGSFLTTFDVSNIFRAAGAVANIGLSLIKPPNQVKLV